FARLLQAIKHAAFGIERRLGRVDVFGFGVLIERARAEGDDAPAWVGDLERDAVAEGVDGTAGVVAWTRRAGGDEFVEREFGFEFGDERGPAIGREADAELLAEFGGEAASAQIIARFAAVTASERFGEKRRGARADGIELLAPFAFAAVFLLIDRQRHARK